MLEGLAALAPKTPITKPKPAKDESLVLIKRALRENGRKYAPRYALAFALMTLVSVFTGASAWILKNVVNDVFIMKNSALIWGIAAAVFVIYAGRGVADYAQTVVMNAIGRDIVADHQKKIYNHLISQDMQYFNTASLGEIIMFFQSGSGAVRSLMNLLMTSVGKDALSLISLGSVMVMMDPILSIFAFLITPGALFGIKSIKNRIRAIGAREHPGHGADHRQAEGFDPRHSCRQILRPRD